MELLLLVTSGGVCEVVQTVSDGLHSCWTALGPSGSAVHIICQEYLFLAACYWSRVMFRNVVARSWRGQILLKVGVLIFTMSLCPLQEYSLCPELDRSNIISIDVGYRSLHVRSPDWLADKCIGQSRYTPWFDAHHACRVWRGGKEWIWWHLEQRPWSNRWDWESPSDERVDSRYHTWSTR